MKDDEVRILADAILAPILAPVGFSSTDVEARPDHAGDESLYVKLRFKPGSEVASGRTYIDAQVKLWDALVEHGETRFPYIRFDYPDDDIYEDDEPEDDADL
jgi:hypothetical protein